MSKIKEKYQKDYKNISYKNPRLIQKQEKRKKKAKKLVLLIIAVIIAAVFYFIFFSYYFQIQQAEVVGLKNVKQENIDQIVNEYRFGKKFGIFSKNNYWFFNKNDLKDKISKNYKFENLEIEKQLPNLALIKIKEKKAQLAWLTNNLCYHLDTTGLAIEFCEGEDNYLRIKDMTDQPIEIGDAPLSEDELDYFIELMYQVNRIGQEQFFVEGMEKTDNNIEIKTNTNFKIFVNQSLGVEEQLARLEFLLSQNEIRNNLVNIEYFDLRFGEKVYYK